MWLVPHGKSEPRASGSDHGVFVLAQKTRQRYLYEVLQALFDPVRWLGHSHRLGKWWCNKDPRQEAHCFATRDKTLSKVFIAILRGIVCDFCSQNIQFLLHVSFGEWENLYCPLSIETLSFLGDYVVWLLLYLHLGAAVNFDTYMFLWRLKQTLSSRKKLQ